MSLVNISEEEMVFMAECYAAQRSPASYFDYLQGMKDAVKLMELPGTWNTIVAERDNELNTIIVK